MKLLILACLAALAYAESESDPYLVYGAGYTRGFYPSVYRSSYVSPYVNTFGYSAYPTSYYNTHLIGKREAESEPESDPAYLLRSPYSTFGYSTLGYPYRSSYVAPYSTYGYAYPSVFGARHLIGKREAEAESDPAYLVRPYGHFGYAAHAGYYPYAAATYAHPYAAPFGVKTYANDAVSPFNYASKGRYAAVNAGAVHYAKREAESDPAYLLGSPYSTYGYSSLAYPSVYRNAYVSPYATYGVNTYNPYRLWY